ncbi:hypothetical protein RRF57_013308 [Xylaria bambusicola]|uniref:Uncharacterized protein n=1 Tax=Xylaria bambusicola TaxID=326684 RepID=A0AAN7V6F1_9PEZI
MDGNLTVGSCNTFGEGVKCGRDAIELSATMIAHNDTITLVLSRGQGIFCCQYTLDPNLHFGSTSEPGDVVCPRVRIRVESDKTVVMGLGLNHLRRLVLYREVKANRCPKVIPPFVIANTKYRAVGR